MIYIIIGIVQGNEECDCGGVCSADPCCDGSTCLLRSNKTKYNIIK